MDGYNVNVVPAPEVVGSRVYESAGGQLWTVVAQGLQEFKDVSWVLHRVPEIAAAFHVGIDPIPLCPVRHGLVIFLLPDRLMEFNSEDPDHPRTKVLHTVSQTRLEKFSSMPELRDVSSDAQSLASNITIRIDRRWLLVALGLALYVLLDIADSGHLDGSIARHALSFILGAHP